MKAWLDLSRNWHRFLKLYPVPLMLYEGKSYFVHNDIALEFLFLPQKYQSFFLVALYWKEAIKRDMNYSLKKKNKLDKILGAIDMFERLFPYFKKLNKKRNCKNHICEMSCRDVLVTKKPLSCVIYVEGACEILKWLSDYIFRSPTKSIDWKRRARYEDKISSMTVHFNTRLLWIRLLLSSLIRSIH